MDMASKRKLQDESKVIILTPAKPKYVRRNFDDDVKLFQDKIDACLKAGTEIILKKGCIFNKDTNGIEMQCVACKMYLLRNTKFFHASNK